MIEKLNKITSILFEALMLYMFFVMCVFSVSLGFVYKPLGISGVTVSIFVLILQMIFPKDSEG